MNAYDRYSNLGKNLVNSVAIRGQGIRIFIPPTYSLLPKEYGEREKAKFQ